MRAPRLIGIVFFAIVLALVAAGCGDDSAEPEPAADDGADEVATGETSSTTASTTAPIPEGGVSVEGLQITAVVFGPDGQVTLTNTGAEAATVDGLWLCNRPAYVELSGTIEPGGTLDVPAADMGGLAADGGEVGLYTSDSFDSPDAMVDYVQWGSGGGRSGVAVDAGLWPEGVTVQPTAELIELFGVPGDPESWS